MAANRKPTGHFWTTPASFRVKGKAKESTQCYEIILKGANYELFNIMNLAKLQLMNEKIDQSTDFAKLPI